VPAPVAQLGAPVASVAEKRKKRNIQKGYDFQKAKRFSRPVDI
jgi:hypothetical protein